MLFHFLKKEVYMTTTIEKRSNGHQPTKSLGNVVDNLFQNSLRRFFDDNFWEGDAGLKNGTAPVNIRETEQSYELDVIAPGCKKEDFNISINDNVLTISFISKEQNSESDRKIGWARNEYVQRSFTRNFTLDDTVDLDNINATYTDGILRLVMAKNEKAKKMSKNIEVK
jgi:HSP20 family protein